MKLKQIALVSAAALMLVAQAAQAAPQSDEPGAYGGLSVGRSSFNLPGASVAITGKDGRDTAYKLYGGYRLNEHFGVEAGYARLGSFSEQATLASGSVTQEGKASSFYAAATARHALTEQFALQGRLGVARSKVSGSNLLPAGDSLQGSKTSVMWGVGAEVKLAKNLALTADYDNYGKVSDKVKASTFMLGARLSF
ncbi:porin family protein [Paucibacter soli]|uniref:porin family protein n=1 Tax=Paucibacter soli TaxID=3133433 RepID=UPI003097F059